MFWGNFGSGNILALGLHLGISGGNDGGGGDRFIQTVFGCAAAAFKSS